MFTGELSSFDCIMSFMYAHHFCITGLLGKSFNAGMPVAFNTPNKLLVCSSKKWNIRWCRLVLIILLILARGHCGVFCILLPGLCLIAFWRLCGGGDCYHFLLSLRDVVLNRCVAVFGVLAYLFRIRYINHNAFAVFTFSFKFVAFAPFKKYASHFLKSGKPEPNQKRRPMQLLV